MRPKGTSKALKRHRKTFHLVRHDPERWEQEKKAALSENLHEAREKADTAEREVEAKERLLMDCRDQVSIAIVYDDERRSHETKRLTPYGGN